MDQALRYVSHVLGRNSKLRGVRKIACGDVVQFFRRAVALHNSIVVGWRPKRAILQADRLLQHLACKLT